MMGNGRRTKCCAKCRRSGREESKKYRARNYEKVRQYERSQWKRYRANARKNQLIRKYGITPQQYDQMLQNQNGRCACCGDHQSSQKHRLHVDHVHGTKIVRGLLCTRCNTAIGQALEDESRLQAMIIYLHRSKLKAAS